MPNKKRRRGSRNITSITYWRQFSANRFWYFVIAILFALGIIVYFGGGLGISNQNAEESAAIGQVIATVNGEPITQEEFDLAWNQIRNNNQSGSELQKILMKGQVFAGTSGMQGSPGLIDEALLRSIAKQKGFKVTNKDIDKQIQQMKTQLGQGKPASDDMFNNYLQSIGLTMNSLRRNLSRELLPKMLMDSITAGINVTRQDLIQSYEQVKLRQILISNQKLPDQQAQAKAEKILKALQGGANFAKMANEFSDDPGNNYDPKTHKPAKQGGEYGWTPVDKYTPPFAAAVEAMKPGQLSGIVKTQYGYHIILLEGKRTVLPKDFNKNISQLAAKMKQQKANQEFQQMLTEGIKTMKVVWKVNSYKWMYDYAMLMNNPMEMMSPGGMDNLIAELRAEVKSNPVDYDASLLLGQLLYYEDYLGGPAMMAPNGAHHAPSAAAKAKVRPEIITALSAALEHIEDLGSEFTLAKLYEDAKEPAQALQVYERIQDAHQWDTTPDMMPIHEQLLAIFKKANQPARVAKEEQILAEIAQAEKIQKQQEAQGQAQEKAAAAAQGAGKGTGTVTVPPGGKSSMQTNAPQPVKPKQ